MYVNYYQHEYQAKALIAAYHRDALRSEQFRIARPDRPSRSFVRSLFSSARQTIGLAPVARPGLVTVPSDTALIA